MGQDYCLLPAWEVLNIELKKSIPAVLPRGGQGGLETESRILTTLQPQPQASSEKGALAMSTEALTAPESVGMDSAQLERAHTLIANWTESGIMPAAVLHVARHGKSVAHRAMAG